MRVGLVAAAGTALLVMAGPSSAAPDRTVQLSTGSRTASWTSDVAAGSYAGVPAAYLVTYCSAAVLDCDETLVEISSPGALSFAVTRSGSVAVPYTSWQVRLYRSDSTGRRGAYLDSDGSGFDQKTVTFAGLAAGRYLVEISHWEGVGQFDVSATLTPTRPARRT